MTTATQLQRRLRELGNEEQAVGAAKFFKTAPGQYAHGDVFIGVRVPQIRKTVRDFRLLPAEQVDKLLQSKIHEERLAGLLVLVHQFGRADEKGRQEIYRFYLARTDRVNNWDLVDLSCHHIVGQWLLDRDRTPLHELARSDSLWERRIAMVSTYAMIRSGQMGDTLQLAEMLLADSEDLIHKAAGWMLREAGKQDEPALLDFLDRFAARMPRTMLRYSLERLSPALRKKYMSRR